MAEQILHGSNVVTAAEQGRRERVAEGVRCGGLRDACLFYGTFEGALKGLVIHVMATHDTARGSVECVCCAKPRTTAGMPGARILPLKGVGKRNAAAALGPVLSHHARARDSCSRRLGAKLSVTSRPDPWSLALPHDDRAVIEIQILTRSCKPSLIRMPVPYRSWANKRCSPSRNRGCEPLHPGSAPPASAATAEVFRSPEAGQIRAQHLAVEEQQGRQCLTMRGDRNLALVRQPDRNASTSLLPKVAG